MRIRTEDELLDPAVRAVLIDEIEGTENRRRKDEAYRRWQVYKDRTADFVIELLLNQFSEDTVREMGYSITNISICRKIINKLARVYTHGVTRRVDDDDEATENLQGLEDVLNANQAMKRANRMLKLQRNVAVYVKPCPYLDVAGNTLHRVALNPLSPYLYDVVEEYYDRTKPMAYILSNYSPTASLYTTRDPSRARDRAIGGARSGSGLSTHSTNNGLKGDGMDQGIADKKEDEGREGDTQKLYVVWTDKYHFTMNDKGQIVDRNAMPIDINTEDGMDQILNDIGEKPIVKLSIDQDNSFWAEGGEDLVDASIVINSLYSQANNIAVVQGYGQFFMTGKNLPSVQTHGPSKAIIAEYDPAAEDPKPEIGFASANPPLNELRAQIESQIALALTTNDMSTSQVSGSLDSGTMAPSGIALIIDKSESMEDVKDQRQIFSDAERELWPIVSKWMQVFNEEGSLDPEQAQYPLPEDMNISLEYGNHDMIQSENEKLDALAKRKALGLNTMEELIMIDQPGLNEDQAKEKLARVEEQKAERLAKFGPTEVEADEPDDEDDEDEPKDQKD
jgi:hypothetical protein